MDDLQPNYNHEIISDQRKVRVLILWKFLASFSTALLVSWFLGSIINNLIFVIIVIASSGILSLTLLLINKSALFPESSFPRLILLSQLVFTVLSIFTLFSNSTPIFILSSIAGLLILLTLDLTFRSKRTGRIIILKEGQAFITGLLIISFLSMLVLPFLFLAAIKAGCTLYLLLRFRTGRNISGIIILRFMLLFFAGFCLVTRISYPDNVITFIFICGEFIEMILYNYGSDINSILKETSLEFQFSEDETEAS